jgi:hypothetical protein
MAILVILVNQVLLLTLVILKKEQHTEDIPDRQVLRDLDIQAQQVKQAILARLIMAILVILVRKVLLGTSLISKKAQHIEDTKDTQDTRGTSILDILGK